MTEHETLWTVTHGSKVWIFRTRQAARNFKKSRTSYIIRSASWGPES